MKSHMNASSIWEINGKIYELINSQSISGPNYFYAAAA